MKKSKLWGMLSILLVISIIFANFSVYAATADTNAPTMTKFAIENAVYNPGDKVYVDTDVKDDVSGVCYVQVQFNSKIPHVDENGIYGGVAYLYDYDTDRPYFKIPGNLFSGEYELEFVEIKDCAGNRSVYDSEKFLTWVYDPDTTVFFKGNYSFSVVNTNEKIYHLDYIRFDKESLSGEGTVNITAKLQEPAEEYSYISLYIGKECEKCYVFDQMYLLYDNTTGLYKGEYTPKSNGNYVINYVELHSDSGSYYFNNNDRTTSDLNPRLLVSGFVEDNNPPKLNSIKLDKTKASIPSVVKVSISATDDVSGVSHAYIYFYKKEKDGKLSSKTAFYTTAYYNEETKTLEGIVDINQYNEEGIYVLESVALYDNSNNTIVYLSALHDDKTYSVSGDQATLPNEVELELYDNIKYDLITGTNTSDYVQKIKETKNDAIISLDSMQNSHISGELFEAIKGTNKKVYIESYGIQWVFDGSKIETIKDIDTSTFVYMLTNYEDNETLSEIFDKALIVDFAENGELPGPALIRVKVDYALRNYIGTEGLYVYHNNENNTFDPIAEEISLTEDGYFEFYITHNSSYTITNQKPDDKYITDNTEVLDLNNKMGNENSRINLFIIIPIVVVVLCIIVVVTIIIVKNKKKKKINKTETQDKNKEETLE